MLSRRSTLMVVGASAIGFALPASAAEDNAANKAAAERYINEVLTQGTLDTLGAILSPNYVSPNTDDAPGIDAYKARLGSTIRTDGYSLKDIKYSIEDEAVKSPNVFIRGYVTATSNEGKAVKAAYFYEAKFKDGLIVSDWLVRDSDSLRGF